MFGGEPAAMPWALSKPYLSAICSARNMWKLLVITPRKHYRHDQLLAVDDVFLSGLRIRLFKNALLVNAMLFKIVSHALGFGERFIRSFSTGDYADGIWILIQIFDGLVETVAKYKARAGLTHLSAEHHHIIDDPVCLAHAFY